DFCPLVPVDAEPAEAVEDRLQRGRVIAVFVGVVDAQDELAAVLAREQPVEQRRALPADVQVAGRARGKTGTNHEQVRPGKLGPPSHYVQARAETIEQVRGRNGP